MGKYLFFKKIITDYAYSIVNQHLNLLVVKFGVKNHKV